MKIVSALESQFEKESVVTIGTFDGVHIGHRKIIQRLVKKANKKNRASLVLTFYPHPRIVLNKDTNIKLLNTLEEKSDLMESLGVDHLVVKKFTLEFSRLSAETFVKEILVDTLKCKEIIIGYDHRFGRNRAANIDDLKEYGEIYDFKVTEISAQEINEVAVSSTKIRQALTSGDLKTANSYLGSFYTLSGTIIKGKGIGKPMGYPTANLHIEEPFKLIPKNGVYAVRSEIEETYFYGMMNIGSNPTVNEEGGQFIEVNYFDFSDNLYGEKIRIELLERLRDEEKFDSLEELKAQLDKDKSQALKISESYHDR